MGGIQGYLEEFGFLCWPGASHTLPVLELRPGEEEIFYFSYLAPSPKRHISSKAAG